MNHSSSGDTVFITGASGSVGEELLARYLLQEPSARLTLLLRPGEHRSLAQRLALIEQACRDRGVPPRVFRRQVRGVPGDVSLPGGGLSEADASWLSNTATAVIHAAADVRFFLPLREARRVNRDGTRNLLELVAPWKRLTRVAVLSTTYVAGRRVGEVAEASLGHRCGFVNTYEQSKYEAERYARGRRDLPIAVYRLPALLGDGQTGMVRRFGAVHQALQLYARGLIEALPALPHSPVHMLPVDTAAATVFELFERRFRPHSTTHVVAPPESGMRFDEFLATVREAVVASGSGAGRVVAPVPLVDAETFDELRRLWLARDRRRGAILTAIGRFVPQQLFPKQFATRQPLPATPPLSEYLPRVVAYCVASGWGRRPVPAGASMAPGRPPGSAGSRRG